MKMLGLVVCALSMNLLSAQEASDLSQKLSALKYRHIGPLGNRVSAVTGVPGTHIFYIGAASGGVFKTEDGGAHWRPIFDGQPVQSIGALAVSPSDPNVVWAGTGESFIRSNISAGMGVYKSSDAGKNWKLMGLEKTGRISALAIHPTNPDIVYAGALGHGYGPQQERGVYRTKNGGETWERVLFVDEKTGVSDMVMDPNNPRILFAGLWEIKIRTWGRWSGGSAGGLFVTRDGGDNWTKLESGGLPKSPTGRIGLAMSAADSSRVYAVIETNANRAFGDLTDHQGVLWRSDDGGKAWTLVSSDNTLVQRPLYYSRLGAAPDDPDEVHFMSVRHTRSLDGGKTYKVLDSGGDHHAIWIDPLVADRMIIGHDQGVSISINRGKTWMRPQLPIAQMYHVAVDDQIPYFVYGNRQDGASARGPSNSLTAGSIPIGAWQSVGGCESGFAVPDPSDPNIVWSGCYEGILERYDHRSGHARNVMVWPDNPEGWPAAPLRYRFQWTFPIAISPHDHNKVYVGSQHVHQTTDGGHSWQVISPDLTSNDKTKQEKTGGLTPDDVSPTYAAVLFAIAESHLEEGLIWAGSNDGKVHLTRDGGKNWTEVTGALPELPAWSTISNIEPSRHAPGRAYLTVDAHQVNDFDPYLYRTEDYGRSWTRIDAGLPRHPLAYLHCVREDPQRAGLLYLGSENELHVSFDDGASWHSLQGNLPHAPVHWLTIQERFGDLAVATYGRGFWILDDITPLRQWEASLAEAPLHLFEPRPAHRFRFKAPTRSQPGDPAAGTNPTYGAVLNYWLAESPETAPRLEIRDEAGRLVRSLPDGDDGLKRGEYGARNPKPLPKKAGLNRVYWDLSHTRSGTVRLRTRPLEGSKTPLPDRGWRPLVEGGRIAPLAAPGRYELRLIVGDQTATRSLVVLKDPHSGGSEAQVRQQSALLLEIRDSVNQVVEMINLIEWVRSDLEKLHLRFGEKPELRPVVDSARSLDEQLQELEGRFFDLRLTGGNARQDSLRWPRRLYSKWTSLGRYIGGADYPPTTQQLEVHQLYKQRLADARKRLQEINDGPLDAFNRLLTEEGLAGVVLKE